MSTSETIEELECRVKAIREGLRVAEKELHNAKVAATGISIGDIVRHKTYGECRVTRVEPFPPPGGKPWLYGSRKKKGGGWWEISSPLYTDWEKIT